MILQTITIHIFPITNENLEEQDNPFKPDKVYSQDDVSKLEAQIDKLKTQLEKEKAKADNAIPNRRD